MQLDTRLHDTCTGELDPGASPGNYVYIKDQNNSNIWYGHMRNDSIIPAQGRVVLSGQMIGNMGSSGFSRANHLHIEVQTNNGNWFGPNHTNPSEYLGEEE